MKKNVVGDEMVYIISALFGFILGAVCTLLFFQTNKTWIKIISPFIGISGAGFSYNFIGEMTGETNINVLQGSLAILLACVILSVPLVLFLLCRMLKDKDGNQIIRIRDIVLGQKKYIDTYYEQRAEELKENFYSKELEEEKIKLNLQREELGERERELENKEKKYQVQVQEGVILPLPIESNVPMTNEFLGQFPDFIEGLAKYINDVDRITEEYIERSSERNKYDLLYSYFLAICSFTMEDLFDTSSRNVRIHFRILKDDKYVKFVAKIGKSIYEEELTPMPLKKGMIRQSFRNQTSLIKSLNLKYDEKGNHRKIWEDYMTLTFCDICKDGVPFLTMGISVKNKEKFKHLLYFLNFYKIENFLQEKFKQIDKAYNIVNTIEENFSDHIGGE